MSDTKEYKNDNYTVQVTENLGCQIEFIVNVSPKTTDMHYRKALKTINKEVSLPGFRKGKAPEDILLKHFNPHVEREWKEQLLEQTFREAMKLTDITPFRQESVSKAEIKNCSREEGSCLEYGFESAPNVPTVDPKELSIEEVNPEAVQDVKINQIIEDIRYQFAEWEPVEGRPVEHGDFIDADIENLDNPGEMLCEDTRLEVADNKIGKWLIDLLIGMNVGESKEATSSQEEGQESPNFVPTHCKVTVKSIVKSILPEVDDALAEKAGVSSAKELKERVVRDLTTLAEEEAQAKRRDLLKKAILANYPFEIPQSLVNSNSQQMIEQKKTEALNSLKEGETLEDKHPNLEEEVQQEVKDIFRWQFIVQEITDQEKVEVTQQDLMKEMMQSNMSRTQQQQDPQQAYHLALTSLLTKKATDCLLAKMS
ncbi:MAG: trigger factor [Chlamydiota bacterium]|nr:trigger factor [Chlamydiota bacterium]